MSPTVERASLFARIRAIYRDAWSMYRTHLGFIVGSAALVLVPFAILDGLGLLKFQSSSAEPLVIAITVVLALATTGFSGLAAIFYAGLLDHTADAWRAGRASPSPANVARTLPWIQLLLASVFAFVIEIVALGAFVIPGLLEGSIADFAGLVLGHHVAVELVAEVMVTLFVASFIDVVEVVTAYHLQRDHPREPAIAIGR